MGRMTPLARMAAASLITLAAACGGSRADGQGPYARQVADAIPMIERGTGLTFKHPPVLERRTKEQVRQFLEARFADQLTDADIAGEQTAYRMLGLIPDTLDLRRFMTDLLTEQVLGFYDPKTKVLYVVDDAPREQVGFVISHELVHALQDQYTNLDSIQQIRGDNDRTMAAQAVIEGQATLVPLQATLGPGANLPGGWDRVRDMIRDNQSSDMAVFRSAPMLLQETLIFPYLSGAEFMRQFEARRPGQVPYGANMPVSTEQILDAAAYFGPNRREPLEIELPAPSVGKTTYIDNMGEFETRLFLFQFLRDQNGAVHDAAGWAGDRYEIVRAGGRDGFVWVTLWESSVQAAQFDGDLEQVIAKRFGNPAQRTVPGGHAYALGTHTITVWGTTIAGHAAVVYVDLPAGVEAGEVLEVKKIAVSREP